MKKAILIAGCVCFCAAAEAQMRELGFYEVTPALRAPVVDGKLDDDAWKDVPRHNRYYAYLNQNSKPGKLKTEFMMIYDAKGLYVAIINYEDRIAKIKKNITEYDNVDIWRDDCAELYFDPAANGIGYYKFTVNPNGARADMKRLDTAVSEDDWNGSGWQAAASIEKDRWVIEAFFPWADLGKTGEAGEVWMFCHARFCRVDGFIAEVSSPGGSYLNTENFGYLYFSDGKRRLNIREIGNVLAEYATAPWCFSVGRELLSKNDGSVKIELLEEMIAKERVKVEALVSGIEKQASAKRRKELDQLKAQYAALGNDMSLQNLRSLQEMDEKLSDLGWRIKLENDFDIIKK